MAHEVVENVISITIIAMFKTSNLKPICTTVQSKYVFFLIPRATARNTLNPVLS